MLTKVEGIIIRSIDYGEGDKILTVWTREIGKIAVMAKGTRKAKSRHSAAVQLFTLGEFLLFGGSQMLSLSQVDIIESYASLRQDLYKTAYASYFAELIYRLTEERERNPYLFELLKQSLDFIDEDKDLDILARIFEMNMLAISGVRPQLDHCVSCGREKDIGFFSVRQGGFLCEACRSRDKEAIQVSEATIKLLRLFQHFDLRRLGNVAVKDITKKQLQQVLTSYIDEHLGLRLKSRSFIDQLHKYKF